MIGDIRRREFITALSGAVSAWPLAARAQQRPALPVIGFLSGGTSGSYAHPEFRQGLSQAGYVEGRNVALEYHWADSQYDRLPALAADLVRRQVSVIVTGGIPAALAAKAATSTIPIVFQTGVDPVQLGLVASLNRPGGNLTGVTALASELMAKQLELLHQLLPTVTVFAALDNPTQPNAVNSRNNLLAAARILGLQLHLLNASTEREFDTVFTTLRELRAGGLVIATDAFLNSRTAQLAALAFRQAVPTISPFPEFAAAGGLMSYGANSTESQRTAGIYTGRILKGEKPADLPVQQPTKIELVINMKTAKALGLTFPITLLGRADEVIE